MSSIRAMTADDFGAWKALWTAYLEFYESSVPEDVYDITFARLINPARDKQNAFVAQNGNALVGLVHYIYHPHNWHKEDSCYLQDLFVIADQRGTGLGRALIEAVYAAADANGTPSVYWMTQEFNHDARKLYENIATLTPFIKYAR